MPSAPGRVPPRVKICTTPPIASDPYRLDRLPRTISMRSIESVATPPRLAAPSSTLLIGTPSTSTSTWFELLPRTKSDACEPCAPLRPISMPTWRPSRSTRSRDWVASMSARVITVTLGSASATACAPRAAVTTTGSSAASWARGAAAGSSTIRSNAGSTPAGARGAAPHGGSARAACANNELDTIRPSPAHRREWSARRESMMKNGRARPPLFTVTPRRAPSVSARRALAASPAHPLRPVSGLKASGPPSRDAGRHPSGT